MVELRVKISDKGQILIPKVFREKYGISEGGPVMLEPTPEGLLIKGRPAPREIMDKLKEHTMRARGMGLEGSKLGDVRKLYLEMEFEEGRT